MAWPAWPAVAVSAAVAASVCLIGAGAAPASPRAALLGRLSALAAPSARNATRSRDNATAIRARASGHEPRALPVLGAARANRTVAIDAAAMGAGRVVSNASGSAHQAPGVIHFLFLINDALPHADIWRMFFSSAPKGSYTVLAHCKDPDGCRRSGLVQSLAEARMIPTVGSWYCHDLVTAMSKLTEAALNLRAAPNGGVEKFVFVSDSTLPVKPFSVVHRELSNNDDSDFCIFPCDQWGWANIDNRNLWLVKHHQWVVLNRAHAEVFVKSWVPVDERSVWHVQLKDDSWRGKERFLSPQHFHHPPQANWCSDEWGFFGTIFGAVEPKGGVRKFPGLSGGQLNMWGPGAMQSQGKCRTFTYWGRENDGPQFNLLGTQIHGNGDAMSCFPRCHDRPATFSSVGDASLSAMRNSPFLFARKFAKSLWMPNFYGTVLAEYRSNSTGAGLRLR